MKYLIAVILALIAFRAFGAENVIFVVDISGSMTYELPKIQKAINDQTGGTALAAGKMGLVSFSGCGPKFVYELVPLAKDNSAAMKEGIKRLRPEGATDIVAPLNYVKGVISKLLATDGECANVILFTDDMDTCQGGNAHKTLLKEIQKMCQDKAKDFKVDVISSTIDEDVKLFLDEIAQTTGGKFHTGGSLDEISEKIKKIVDGYNKKTTGTPLPAKASKPETTGEGKAGPKTPAPQQKQLPAQRLQFLVAVFCLGAWAVVDEHIVVAVAAAIHRVDAKRGDLVDGVGVTGADTERAVIAKGQLALALLLEARPARGDADHAR